jgi:hypothetical protein
LRSIVPGLYVLTRPILIKIYERRGGEVTANALKAIVETTAARNPFIQSPIAFRKAVHEAIFLMQP